MNKYSILASRAVRIQIRKRLIRLLTAVITLAGIFAFTASAPALAATPKPAKLTISPGSYQYGTVIVGTSSAGQSFAVTNTGQSV